MKVLITGFAGSLGTAFTNYCLARGDEVVGIDNNEWAVASFPEHPKLTKTLDIASHADGKYDLIIHLAAYKHIDLIEENKAAAHKNNIEETLALYGNTTGHILFISTDKAVEPSSYYGWTKQEGERITADSGGVIARLGNIIHSSGSVIPRWEAAIEKGEPLPITDPEMTRWMIPADEAVAKIMALLPKALPGQVIIPEMGEPINLMDLLDKVLESKGLWRQKLSVRYDENGYNHERCSIVTVGLRPGEKMHEKLKWDYEKTTYSDENGEIVEGEEE